MSNCWRTLALTGTDLSANHAQAAPMRISGIQMNAAFWYHTCVLGLPATFIACEPPRNPIIEKPMSHGVSSCTRETPRLPMPACRPSAVPCMRRGKK